VLVCGYYGFGNAGDEAILTVLLEDLRSHYPAAEIDVLSGNPIATSARYGVSGVEWGSPAALMEASRRADLMVLGGGGLIQDYNGFNAADLLTSRHGDVIWAEFALLARMCSKPLAIYAIGVGPLSSDEGRKAARLTFELASSASVRDELSAKLLADIGVPPTNFTVSADPVFRLQPSQAEGSVLDAEGMPAADMTIGACLRPWRSGLPIAELASALDLLVEKLDARVIFLPFQLAPTRNENDAFAAHEVMLAMEHADRAGIVRGSYGPAEKLAIFSSFDAVVAMRLHAAMFGLKAGRPTVAISYDPKVDSLMNDCGLSEFVIQLPELSAHPLVTKVQEAIDRQRTKSLPTRLQRLTDRSALSREVLGEAADRHQPNGDSEVLRLLADAALARSKDLEQLEKTEFELQLTRSINDHLRGELAEVHDSRAQRLARQYWKLRQTARDSRETIRRTIVDRKSPSLAAGPERFSDAADYGGAFELRTHYAQQLAQILRDNPQAVGNVVLPHSIGWKSSLFQRPQQMALALARQGYLVFYGLDHFTREETDGFRWVAPNVYLFSMDPHYLDILKGIEHPLTLTYVYNFRFIRHLEDPVTVFEHIDELEVFTATHPMDHLIQWYEDAITHADIVVASAHDLLQTVLARRPDALLCQNGVDFDHFYAVRPHAPPTDLEPIVASGKPVIGYYGALAEWLDYPMLEHAARQLPSFEFVFIGPNYDESMDSQPVFGLPNVHWLGPKSYDELPTYLHHFTVATIPFLVNQVTHAVSPVKLNEYLAAGKPVVTTATREALQVPVLGIAHDAADWVGKLEEAVERAKDAAFVERLIMTARANTWDQRVGVLIDAAARLHKL
jgi:polysaccharide pyruvyl transferase CsaB